MNAMRRGMGAVAAAAAMASASAGAQETAVAIGLSGWTGFAPLTLAKEAADLLLEIGVIKQIPDLKALADTSFIK